MLLSLSRYDYFLCRFDKLMPAHIFNREFFKVIFLKPQGSSLKMQVNSQRLSKAFLHHAAN